MISLNKLRWKFAMVISRFGWWIMPEPQRSRAYRDFDDAIEKIKQREELKERLKDMNKRPLDDLF